LVEQAGGAQRRQGPIFMACYYCIQIYAMAAIRAGERLSEMVRCPVKRTKTLDKQVRVP
jgi:hypothetical protein